MSWTVANLSNTVVISPELANKLIEAFPDIPAIRWCKNDAEKLENLLEGDILYFTTDHQEWIDWLTEEICQCMADDKAQGEITFGSVEGDNAGTFWGYRFDGKGGFKRLTGSISWAEE